MHAYHKYNDIDSDSDYDNTDIDNDDDNYDFDHDCYSSFLLAKNGFVCLCIRFRTLRSTFAGCLRNPCLWVFHKHLVVKNHPL